MNDTALKKFYYWFRKKITRPGEKEDPSAGYWPDMVRTTVLDLCKSGTGSVFEVGCGGGLFLVKLAQKNQNFRIFGIDIIEDLLLMAKGRLEGNKIDSVDLVQADALSVPFKDNCFDTVVCINTFINMPEDVFRKSLPEITRVCKRGGRIIFDVRNSMNPLVFVKYRLAKLYDGTVTDFPFRTDRFNKVAPELEKLNLEIIRRVNIGFPKNNFAPIFVIEARKK